MTDEQKISREQIVRQNRSDTCYLINFCNLLPASLINLTNGGTK